jgi:serine/threonine protein kinase
MDQVLNLLTAGSDATDGPTRIGRYAVRRKLGEGNFGTVYLAWDEVLEREVALKVPRPGRLTSQEAVAEARKAAGLRHPWVVAVYTVEQDATNAYFVVMEYVAGPKDAKGNSLREVMESRRLGLGEAIRLLAKVAEAIHHAHRRGIVHRDLKPANILIDEHGDPHVADFGLAVTEADLLERKGEVAGSPAYMSPEQVRGETQYLDGRTDVWSLGIILYELLTSRRPFGGKDVSALWGEIRERPPKPPRQIDETIPEELERICLCCLAKNVEQRYRSAYELAAALRRWTPEGADPVDRYLKIGLPEACDRWFRPDDRFAFHPRDQFVPLPAQWDGEGGEPSTSTDDVVADVVGLLRRSKVARVAISANYGQGKTFLAWKLALVLAAADDRSHLPFFYPLKEYNPNSRWEPFEQISHYLDRHIDQPSTEELFNRHDCLLILDAVDEMPVSYTALLPVLQAMLQALNRFSRLAILLTFRTGVFAGSEHNHKEFPTYHMATLKPWQAGGQHWERLVRLCHETSYAPFRHGWARFRDEVARRPLCDLTSRPLWCRLIIERRDTVLDQEIRAEADLYSFYVDAFFNSKAAAAHYLTSDQKLRVLELLAVALANSGSKDTWMTEDELRRQAARAFRLLPESQLTDYLTHELGTYTLLNCETTRSSDQTIFTFGHQSFQEFFQARALVRLLGDAQGDLGNHQADLHALCTEVATRDDVLGFVIGLLHRSPTAANLLPSLLRRSVRAVFGVYSDEVNLIRRTLLLIWVTYCRRALGQRSPDLTGFQLERLLLVGLDLSGCCFRLANFAGTHFIRCELTRTEFGDSRFRGTRFEACKANGEAFRGSDRPARSPKIDRGNSAEGGNE